MGRSSRVRAVVIGVSVSACGATYGADGLERGGSGPRAVKCASATCGGADVCCVREIVSEAKCSDNCSTGRATINCDDTADCGPGMVCCVSVDVSGRGYLKATSCLSSCQATPSLRACDPNVAGECGARKGCHPLTDLYSTIYPAFPVFVCE